MQLVANKMVRLYEVSDKLNEHGLFQLKPLDVAAFNVDMDESEIEDTLTDLARILYDIDCCGADWHEIPVNRWYNGTVGIKINDDDYLEIPDIVDKIDVDPETTRFFIVLCGTRSQYFWVVSVPQGTVYSA